MSDSNAYVFAIILALSCSTACSPVVMMFLGTFILRGKGSTRQGTTTIISYFGGKSASYLALCMASAWIGQSILEKTHLLPMDVTAFTDLFFLLFGSFLLYKVVRNRKPECGKQDSCDCRKSDVVSHSRSAFLFGVLHGITPCTPMVLLISTCALLTIPKALLVSSIFAIFSSLSPLLIMGMIAGRISGMLWRELPNQLKRYQIASSIAFIGYSLVALVSGNLFR